MKFIKVLIILMALSCVLNRNKSKTRLRSTVSLSIAVKPVNNCKLIIVDNDDVSTQNSATFFGDVKIPKLNCDLSEDVREIIVENALPLNYQNECAYEFKACTGENYTNCGKVYSGSLAPGKKSIFISDIIKKMKSIKMSQSVQPLPKNDECKIRINDNDGTFKGNHNKVLGGGLGMKSSFVADLNDDVKSITMLNQSQTEQCTCKIDTYHNINYSGSTFSNTLQAKEGYEAEWTQRKNENWQTNMSSIKWDCTILKDGLLDYFN